MDTFFNNLLVGVINFISYVCNLILSPINSLINTALNFTNAGVTTSDIADTCEYFFSELVSYGNWFLSFTGIPQIVIDIIIIECIGMLTVPLAVRSFKLAIAWYNNLKVG